MLALQIVQACLHAMDVQTSMLHVSVSFGPVRYEPKYFCCTVTSRDGKVYRTEGAANWKSPEDGWCVVWLEEETQLTRVAFSWVLTDDVLLAEVLCKETQKTR